MMQNHACRQLSKTCSCDKVMEMFLANCNIKFPKSCWTSKSKSILLFSIFVAGHTNLHDRQYLKQMLSNNGCKVLLALELKITFSSSIEHLY